MIYLLRHGLDDERYIGGWSNVDLISKGKKQVKKATKFIVDNELIINSILSSDVKRAVTTSSIVNHVLNVDVCYTSYLRELDKGDFTGVLKSKLSGNELKKITNFNIYDKYPNGESMIDLYRRIKIYLEELKEYNNVLLVTHRGVINMFYYLLNDIPLDMNKKKFNVDHASIHQMDIKKSLIRRIY